jgi:hypothetical protein
MHRRRVAGRCRATGHHPAGLPPTATGHRRASGCLACRPSPNRTPPRACSPVRPAGRRTARHRGRRTARNWRHPTAIGPQAGRHACCATRSQHRPAVAAASTVRASLGYSRVLAGRQNGCRAISRQHDTLPGVANHPGIYCVMSTTAAMRRDRMVGKSTAGQRSYVDPGSYSPALARLLRRGVGSPVPRTYEDARWFQAQLWQTSTT